MKINENSWHFRLIRFNSSQKARNLRNCGGSLCGYFWTVVWAILVCTCQLSAALLMGWLFFYQPISYIWAPDDDKLILVIMWAVIGVVAVAIGAFCYIKSQWDYISSKLFKEVAAKPKKKEPNILVEYIRAKKQKFCPIIEIVKDEK